MVQSRKDGCNLLQYTFRYNKAGNTIEVGYSFSSGVLEHGGTIVVMRPHVNTLRYGRKQSGRNSEIDAIFDDRKKMAEVTEQAEQRFSEILGGAIERGIRRSAHQALYQAGIKLRGNPTQMARTLAQADRTQISKELGVKRGAPKGVKQKQLHGFTKKTFQAALEQKIRDLSRHEDARLTREAVAHLLGLRNGKALDRLRKRYGDTRPWPDIVG